MVVKQHWKSLISVGHRPSRGWILTKALPPFFDSSKSREVFILFHLSFVFFWHWSSWIIVTSYSWNLQFTASHDMSWRIYGINNTTTMLWMRKCKVKDAQIMSSWFEYIRSKWKWKFFQYKNPSFQVWSMLTAFSRDDHSFLNLFFLKIIAVFFWF